MTANHNDYELDSEGLIRGLVEGTSDLQLPEKIGMRQCLARERPTEAPDSPLVTQMERMMNE